MTTRWHQEDFKITSGRHQEEDSFASTTRKTPGICQFCLHQLLDIFFGGDSPEKEGNNFSNNPPYIILHLLPGTAFIFLGQYEIPKAHWWNFHPDTTRCRRTGYFTVLILGVQTLSTAVHCGKLTQIEIISQFFFGFHGNMDILIWKLFSKQLSHGLAVLVVESERNLPR